MEPIPVAQTFLSAGSGDFPVASSMDTGLEGTWQSANVNPQAGKPALHHSVFSVTSCKN